MHVRYDQVSKQFGSVTALNSLDLTIEDGEFLVMLGPSGCGKTTALRCLAGLERPTSGRIWIGNRDVTHLQPRDRDIAMVFQSYALYPHLSVAENIAYPLKIRKVPRDERIRMAQKVADRLSIGHLMERRPRQLSGGQRQRVALARALVREPNVFLMDEPLSNLDAKLRVQMRGELKHLQKTLSITTLYVTHDQAEAMTMADRVAVLSDGVLQQIDDPEVVYRRPANLFVASFVGSPAMNLFEVQINETERTFCNKDLSWPIADHLLPMVNKYQTDTLIMGIRPENITITMGDGHGIPTTVYAVEPMGNETIVMAQAGEILLTARAEPEFRPTIGDPCRVQFDNHNLHLFEIRSGRRLDSLS